jgi:hypothetical protein
VSPLRAATVLVLLHAAAGAGPTLQAQDTTAVPAAAPAAVSPDSARFTPITPINAFWRSFLLPGWGQARLNRKLTGGIFVAWEGVTLGMSLKTRRLRSYNSRALCPGLR